MLEGYHVRKATKTYKGHLGVGSPNNLQEKLKIQHSLPSPPPPYVNLTGTCGPIGYGFSEDLVLNGVSIS